MATLAFETLAPLEPLMDKCVHCGFCLATCPSYLLLGQEMDSPRGRIYLMKAGVEERVAMSDTFVNHFDTCLGCMACETACPSGVRYAPLIEETRAAIEHHHPRPLGDRLFRFALFQVLPYPARLRLLSIPMAAVNALLRRFPRALALLPWKLRNLIELAPERAPARGLVPAHTPSDGPSRLRVGLLTGCVQRVFFAHVNEATTRILAAEGCDVVAPPGQGCCGALALHAGQDENARAFARALIAVFEPHMGGEQSDRNLRGEDGGANMRGEHGQPYMRGEHGEPRVLNQIVVNAAGCGSTMKTYGDLLKDDQAWAARARAFAAKVRDVTETLAGLVPPRAVRQPVEARVAYHDACHLAHAQGVRREPRELLASIPGVTLVPLAENDICCGSAGIFNLVEPALAGALGRRKAAHIADSHADMVVTSNPGCILQIRAASRAAGTTVPVLHVVELLDASLRRAPAAPRQSKVACRSTSST